LNNSLKEEINQKRDTFGFQKEQTKRLLKSYSKLISTKSKKARDPLERTQRLIDKIVVVQPHSNLDGKDLEKIIQQTEDISSKFRAQFEKTQSIVTRLLQNQIRKDFANTLIQPKGLRLDMVDSETFGQLNKPKLRRHLRISLNE